jgi:HK97 family phage prohead protease
MATETTFAPPRDDLYRMITGPGAATMTAGPESDDKRDAGAGDASVDGGPVMEGYFAVFDQWTEIDSWSEGNFLERISPGAFKKTITENRDAMRVLFQHGMDPVFGDKPLGPIRDLAEDTKGPAYAVPLLRTSYNTDLEQLLRSDPPVLGASFRFRVTREELVDEGEQSDYNPRGLPERTIKEAQVMEFGPVTFPAYAGASAGIRSITDAVRDARVVLRDMPKLTEACRSVLLDQARLDQAHEFLAARAATVSASTGETADAAPSEDADRQQDTAGHLSSERRGDQSATDTPWWIRDDERSGPPWARSTT